LSTQPLLRLARALPTCAAKPRPDGPIEELMAKSDPEKQLVDGAFRLLARKSWSELTLAAIARAAKLSLVDALAIAPSKAALVGVILRATAHETSRRYKPDSGPQSARERIFDVTMTWFEVQQPKKPAMRALYTGLRGDPLALISARREVIRCADQILALAEADAGPAAFVVAGSLAGILLRATFVWIDDGRDMDKTMAQLDRDLRRLGRLFRL
jgi:ubiquinone biosynthesis protein COQ9